jgi:LuxR family maltose regulon positive regulatory protein
MSTPILATKLYIPSPRPKAVLRPRLTDRLKEGLPHSQGVTLISAPAGFGKTSLVSEWVADCQRLELKVRVAWLSLEQEDSDPIRFLAYLVAALQTVAPQIGQEVVGLLQSPQPPPPEAILTTLLNEITILPDKFVLVLDDYHVIDSKPVDLALTFLLDHLPPQIHLVITTREDPQLPLARLRARGQMTELRAADLRFTAAEAAEFLGQVMGLSLSTADITALEDRTEGWIAGLQLAALSVQDHQDVSGFIRALTGDHRYIVDYLVEEVLQRQPEPVRNFLLQTAILDQLNGSLCDAVTGQAGGKARLEALERGNFFVVPLDDQRHWYRYHHLFAEVLQAHLVAERPDQAPMLHRRASEWYEQNGSAAQAIRHALAAEDFERAANLVELAVPAMRQSRQQTTVLGWLKALPDPLLRARPVLSVHYAGSLLVSGVLEGVEARLRDAERWLDTAAEGPERPEAPSAETSPAKSQGPSGEQSRTMVVVDEEEFRGLPGSIAIYRAAIALALGDVAGTLKYARRVLDVVPEDDHLRRGSAAGFLGLAYWTSGDLEAAHQSYAECMARLQKAGYLSDAIGCAIALADIRIAQGHLHEAMRTYEAALRPVTEPGAPVLLGTADLHVGMSELFYERDDLNAATQHLLRSQELGDFAGSRQNPYRWRVAMARIRVAQGDLGGAVGLLDEAERLYASDFFPNVRPIAALKTRAWLAQGRLGEATSWAREKGLSIEDDLSYLREFEHITLARVLLARHRSDQSGRSILEAMGLLERLLKAAEEGQRAGHIIEILVLQALAHQMKGDIPAAIAPLERALTLAEPEGYVRMFVDEGPSMAILLEKAAKQRIAPSYVRQLLTALGKAEGGPPVNQALIEPLSERELEVVRLLKTELTGPEMARELSVSLSTLRTHTQKIFSKLGVNSRRAAVRRAEELNL